MSASSTSALETCGPHCLISRVGHDVTMVTFNHGLIRLGALSRTFGILRRRRRHTVNSTEGRINETVKAMDTGGASDLLFGGAPSSQLIKFRPLIHVPLRSG